MIFVSRDNAVVLSSVSHDKIRKPWHQIWMEMAHLISERSYDPRMKVGSVVVSEDNTTVLAVGYNGNAKGLPNEPESLEPGKSEFIHSEVNACIKLDYSFPKNKIMYVTLSPCVGCAKVIINAGISKVIYDIEYRDLSGLKILKLGGVEVQKFSDIV